METIYLSKEEAKAAAKLTIKAEQISPAYITEGRENILDGNGHLLGEFPNIVVSTVNFDDDLSEEEIARAVIKTFPYYE